MRAVRLVYEKNFAAFFHKRGYSFCVRGHAEVIRRRYDARARRRILFKRVFDVFFRHGQRDSVFVERRRNISYLKPERSCRRVNRLVRRSGNDYFVGAVSYRAHCDENPRRAARGQIKAVFRAVRFRAFLFAFKDNARRILQIVRKIEFGHVVFRA